MIITEADHGRKLIRFSGLRRSFGPRLRVWGAEDHAMSFDRREKEREELSGVS
jgi:hypothetical protein